MHSNEEFARYLGVDYENKYGLVKITCPFHNDSHPSMVIYPELERGAYCFACGQGCNWAWLAHTIKGISYKQALQELGQENLAPSERRPVIHIEQRTFCDEPNPVYTKAYSEKHNACSTDYPKEMVDFLERKHLLETARELDWRWHDGTVFKGWRKGIVIPYKQGDDIVYERIREWNGEGFDKPKGSFNVGIQPYFTTFRPNSVQYFCEGETDSASIYALGGSALATPGSVAKKAINTIVAFCADRPYIKELVLCGDNDQAGERMNMLARQAVQEIAPRLHIRTFKHTLTTNKADINDEYVKGLLRLSEAVSEQKQIEKTEAPDDFLDYVDSLSSYLDACEERGVDPWKNNDKGVGQLNTHAITDSLADVPIVVAEKVAGRDDVVAVSRFKVQGAQYFVVEVDEGANAGYYEVSPYAIANGWSGEVKTNGGGILSVLVLKLEDLISTENLDFCG